MLYWAERGGAGRGAELGGAGRGWVPVLTLSVTELLFSGPGNPPTSQLLSHPAGNFDGVEKLGSQRFLYLAWSITLSWTDSYLSRAGQSPTG